jgi:glutathione S-transferase
MVSLSATGTPNPANLAFSPTARVPCLHDGATVVWDSLAIAEYLAERHPGLWPADPVPRAWARSVGAEMHSGFSALRNEMTMCIRERVDVRPWSSALECDIARVIAIWNDGRRRFGRGGPFLCGEFSVADAFYAPVAYRFRTYDVTPDGAAGDYLKALLAQPLLRQWEDAALQETEIIEADEPRLIYRDKLAARGGTTA